MNTDDFREKTPNDTEASEQQTTMTAKGLQPSWRDRNQRSAFRKERPRRYRWALWLGLGLWLGCTGILWLIKLLGGPVDEQGFLNDMIRMLAKQIGFGGIFFMIAILGPFSEEVAFRLWGIGRKWAYVVTALFILLFAGAELGFLWGAIAAVCVLVCAFAVANVNLRTTIMIWLTSATFAACHFDGYNGFSISMALGLISIFGLALVLNYLTIHHCWGLAVLLHMLNNGIACFGMQDELKTLCQPHNPITITTEAYELTLEHGYSELATPDTTVHHIISGTASTIAQNIINTGWCNADLDTNGSVIFQYNDIDYASTNNETYTITLKSHDGQSHWKGALQMLQDSGFVRLDTTVVPAFVAMPAASGTISSDNNPAADDASDLTAVCQYLCLVGIYAQPAKGTERMETTLTQEDLKPIEREYATYKTISLPQFQKKAEKARNKMLDKVTSAGITVKEVPGKQTRHILIHEQ